MITDSLIKFVLNAKFERFGKMLKLEINSINKTIVAEVLLNGELSPIQINVGHYEILTTEKNGIKLSQISTSKEWLTELIQELAPTPTLEFDHAKLLKNFL